MHNLRDFGGYETADGRRIRRGLLFRSGFPRVSPARGQEQFEGLAIQMVCDLRRDDECTENPPPAFLGPERRAHVPIAPGSSTAMRAAVASGAGAAEIIDYMTRMTREIAEHHASYARVFDLLLDCEQGFLIHCSAGKDRTGFGAALIHAALGVGRETIYHDYLLSNAAVPRDAVSRANYSRYFGQDLDDERFHALAGVRKEYLDAALAEVERRHGSLLGYLGAIGVDASRRQLLQERLLEPL